MIQIKSLVTASLAVSIAMAAVALLMSDWMWLVVDLLSILLLLLPYYKDVGYYYSRNVVWMSMLAPTLVVIYYLVDHLVYPVGSHILLDVSYTEYFNTAFQALQCFVSGFMLALLMDRSFGMTLTKRWMVLFAMMISLAVSVLDLFFMFGSLYADGAPVFNGDFQHGQERYSNRILIVSPFVATFASAAYAIIAAKAVKRHDKSEFTQSTELRKPVTERKERRRDDVVPEYKPIKPPNNGWGLDDAICVAACLIILGMSIVSLASGFKMSYEVNTGIFCGLFCLVPIALKHARIITLPKTFIIAIAVAIFLHAYGVLLLRYDVLVYYDTVTHTISSVVVSLCVYYTLMCYHAYSQGKVNFSGWTMSIFVAVIMMGFSAYWEVFEFIVDITTGTNMQYSPFDTLRDMLANTFGSMCVSIALGFYLKDLDLSAIVKSFQLHPKLMGFIQDPFGENKQAGKS